MKLAPARRGCLIFIFVFALCACRVPGNEPSPAERTAGDAWFTDIAAEVGIDFVHRDGRSGRRYYVETAASGGGWLDYDGDGDLDLYLLNGAETPGSELDRPPRNALYANRGGRFVEVGEAAGVGDRGYGMGLCTGDYDGDGWLDLFVTNYGADRLFRNRGDGSYEEVGEPAGVAGRRWGTNCAFADLDGDGDLDLYVANYVDFRFESNPVCGDPARDVWSYCRPAVFAGQPDYLYINRGDGSFSEEGGKRGIDQGVGDRGFGVIASDVTGDGAVDILVANDGTANRLYVNDGRGHFTDRGAASGFALDRDGRPLAGMGLDLGDVDGDGREDLMVTNYALEAHTLYLSRDGLVFDDRTVEAGLAGVSYRPVGWGIQLFDADNDGDLDLAMANGHVVDTIAQFEPQLSYPQPNQLLENDGRGRFRDRSADAGPPFAVERVSRGLAAGDWNDDGRLDLLVTNTNERPELLENRHPSPHRWIGFVLRGGAGQAAIVGTEVRLFADGELVGVREVRSGGSFLAQPDPRLHFGLGATRDRSLRAEVRWPDGTLGARRFDAVDRYLVLEQPVHRPVVKIGRP